VLQRDGGVFVELESDAVALAWLGLRLPFAHGAA
jgi:hypothetical protein